MTTTGQLSVDLLPVSSYAKLIAIVTLSLNTIRCNNLFVMQPKCSLTFNTSVLFVRYGYEDHWCVRQTLVCPVLKDCKLQYRAMCFPLLGDFFPPSNCLKGA